MENEEHDSHAKPSKKSTIATLYEYYLTGEILRADHYIGWFDEIRNASEVDSVKIYINSVGGRVSTALQFLRVMEESAAHITCSIEGDCMSAATMIFLAADSFEISRHSSIMIHTYSGGVYGKGQEIHQQAQFEVVWSKKLLKDTYKDFLTPKEIKQVSEGRDIWLTSKETGKRCQNLLRARQILAESEQEQEQEQEQDN